MLLDANRTTYKGEKILDKILTVFYDGSCPLCRREIDWYRRQDGAHDISWLDVSSVREGAVAPGLCTADALRRFHVRSVDGELFSGARAFAELWASLPRWRRVGEAMRKPWLLPVMETAYRVFLTARPILQRLALRREASQGSYPKWLARELRSDHAGEAGAVEIYRGVLAVTRNRGVRDFAERHLATERGHLQIMERVVPPAQRSRLLPLWRSAGFITGALPALFGASAVYATIDAVESFVDRHYAAQINALKPYPQWAALRDELQGCWQDELEHRNEARARSKPNGLLARAWAALVGAGSHAGVAVARRL